MAQPLTAQVAHKKQPGTLTYSATTLAFTPSSSPSPSISIPTSSISALFASKPGGARVMLKVQFTPPRPTSEDSHNFTFTSPTSALQDRDRFKDTLSAIVAQNRERDAAAATAGGGAGAAKPPGAGAVPPAQPSVKGKERAVDSPAPASSRPASGSSTPLPPSLAGGPSSSSEFRSRRAVLQSDPALLALHRELVQTGLVTESEFWSGREELLTAQAAEAGLVRGKSGEMVDPKTVTGQNGEVTVKVTPALIREIFEEWPVVLRAYNENVPEPLSEPAFWTRYFQSKLFNRNRTTNRAAVDALKDDAIFDRYLGDEDDEVEPHHLPEHEIYRLLDLKASEEDQHEAPTLPRDHTMKPGGQRASLPLMRRFNEHSERLLHQALGSGAQGARERGYVDPGHAGDRRYYSEIELSDLSSPSTRERVALTLSEQTGSSSAAGAGAAEKDALEGEDEGEGALQRLWERRRREREAVEGVRDEWDGRLGEFEADAAAVRDAMRDMTATLGAQAERTRKTAGGGAAALPRHHSTTVSSLSTTTFEFLRHFWSALLPPSSSLPASQTPSPADRAARVEKFKGYLEKSRARIDKAISDARAEGEGGEGGGGGETHRRVEAALRPVGEAVEQALKTYGERMGAGEKGKGKARGGGTPAPGAPPPPRKAVAAG